MALAAGIFILSLCMGGCAAEDPVEKLIKMPKIDGHVHIRGDVDNAAAAFNAARGICISK